MGTDWSPHQRSRPLDVAEIYAAHGSFVWKSLVRMGVRTDDLADVTQEVFVVVHRRLASREGTSSMTTWLYGICLKVAAAYRRKAFRQREQSTDVMPEPEPSADAESPETALLAKQARARLSAILDEIDVDLRAVFVMFEIDELPCHEIATMTGAPLGTVFTRLRAARAAFEQAAKRARVRDARRVMP